MFGRSEESIRRQIKLDLLIDQAGRLLTLVERMLLSSGAAPQKDGFGQVIGGLLSGLATARADGARPAAPAEAAEAKPNGAAPRARQWGET